jgi:hypothetical protein
MHCLFCDCSRGGFQIVTEHRVHLKIHQVHDEASIELRSQSQSSGREMQQFFQGRVRVCGAEISIPASA